MRAAGINASVAERIQRAEAAGEATLAMRGTYPTRVARSSRTRMTVWAVLVLCVCGWPLCGSEDSETSQPTLGGLSADRLRQGKSVSRSVAAMVGQLRQDSPEGRSGSGAVPSTMSLDTHGDTGSNAPMRAPVSSRRHSTRRGLQSSALRMLNNLAEFVLPQSGAKLSGIFAKMSGQQRSGGGKRRLKGWAELYVCHLHNLHEGLSASRLREEELERKENGEVRSEIRVCRSELAQIQKKLANVVQDAAAIGHSLRVWQRIGQGLESRETSSSSSDSVAKAAANVQRLKSERLGNELDARALQAQEKLARIRCGLREWQETHRPTDLGHRRSKLLARAAQQIDELGIDAPALANISRSIALNVTLPACSSGAQRRWSLLSAWLSQSSHGSSRRQGESDQAEWEQAAPESAGDILAVLHRSLQQASHDLFFDLQELTIECAEVQDGTRWRSNLLRNEDLQVAKTHGDILHLERTVAAMQTELVALQTALTEAHEQASRLQQSMGGAHLGSDERELCIGALDSLVKQQSRASDQIAAKTREMAAPKLEIARLRGLLDEFQETEVATRQEMRRDVLRKNVCEVGLSKLRSAAAIISRHSVILTQLVDDQVLAPFSLL